MSGAEAPAAVLVHTHAGHAPTFAKLWGSQSEANLAHTVDASLLAACQESPDSAATAERVDSALKVARSIAPVVGVTCVLVGAVAARHGIDSTGIMWINDSAATVAAAKGGDRYLLVEAVPGAGDTFATSLVSAGVDRGSMRVSLHDEVWPGLAEEDSASYSRLAEVATEAVAGGSVVVLTQASMAPVSQLLSSEVADRVVTTQLPLVHQLVSATVKH